MLVAVLTSPQQPPLRQLWNLPPDITLLEAPEYTSAMDEAALLIDLQYESRTDRNINPYGNGQQPVLTGSVIDTLAAINGFGHPVARFNHWPGFLEAPVTEWAVADEQVNLFTNLLTRLGRAAERTADVPGFVTASVVALIINEAFLAAAEGVSTPGEIDTAMKLGTNYPKGPFEWCNLLGQDRVYSLLQKRATIHHRYQPAPSLQP